MQVLSVFEAIGVKNVLKSIVTFENIGCQTELNSLNISPGEQKQHKRERPHILRKPTVLFLNFFKCIPCYIYSEVRQLLVGSKIQS